jgi:hypothetical protein
MLAINLSMNLIQVPHNGGKQVNNLGAAMLIHLHGRDTGGTVAVVETHDSPGCGPPSHIRRREDDTFKFSQEKLNSWSQPRPSRPIRGTPCLRREKFCHLSLQPQDLGKNFCNAHAGWL